MAEIRIVFDGPPSHESGRFVEVEDTEGRSIRAGSWHVRDDNLRELRIGGVNLEEMRAAWEASDTELRIAEEDEREAGLANGQFGAGA